jgi:hypothetical protein
MFNELKFYGKEEAYWHALADWQDELNKRHRGGHLAVMARMTRAASARAPRQHLSTLPGSSRPKEAV